MTPPPPPITSGHPQDSDSPAEFTNHSKIALAAVLETIRDVYGYDRAIIFNTDPLTNTLCLVVATPKVPNSANFKYTLSETSFAAHVYNTQKPSYCHDPYAPNSPAARKGLELFDIHSPLVGIPLTFENYKLGVLVAWNTSEPIHSEQISANEKAAVSLLTPIASLITVHLAIDFGIMSAAVRLGRDLLLESQRGLSEATLTRLALHAVRAIGFERARYFTFKNTDSREGLALRDQLTYPSEPRVADNHFLFADTDPYAKDVILTSKEEPQARLYDPSKHPLGVDPFAADMHKPKDLPWIVAPIVLRGNLFGTLVADNAVTSRPMPESAVENITLIAACFAIALKQLSELDVTGLSRLDSGWTSRRIRVFRKDLHYRITYVNQSFADDLNKSIEDVLGHTDEQLYPDAWLWQKFRRDDEGVVKQGKIICGTEQCRINGRFTSVAVYKWPLVNAHGAVIGLQGFYILEPFRSLFNSEHEGIYQSTPDGRYLNVNIGLAKILGYESPDELLSANLQIDKDVFVDADRRGTFDKLMKAVGRVSDFEYEIKTKDDRRIKVCENACAVKADDQTILYYEGFVDDIRQRLNKDARIANEDREQAETLNGRILAHDLGSRLRRFVEHSATQLGASETNEFNDLLIMLNQLTDGSFFVAEANDQAHVGRAVVTAKNLNASDQINANVYFDMTAFQPGDCIIPVRYKAFVQLLDNLICNAFEALQRVPVPRNISISARVVLAESIIGADPTLSGRWLVFTFSDNGPGIPPIYKDIQNAALSAGNKKRGIGLFIVKRIVDLAGGYIRVDDNHPRGTKIHIELPTLEKS